jgi:hypothetical protein
MKNLSVMEKLWRKLFGKIARGTRPFEKIMTGVEAWIFQ